MVASKKAVSQLGGAKSPTSDKNESDQNASIPRMQEEASSNKDCFETIYQNHIWGGEDEFYSGAGSHDESIIRPYIELLERLIAEHGIRRIVEVGCGDFNIMKQVLGDIEKSGISYDYTGMDVVSDLISHNDEVFGTKNIHFRCADASDPETDLPDGDILIIRQVLQHLSNRDIKRILAKTRKYRYLLITEHIYEGPGIRYNLDKPVGPGIRLSQRSGVYIEKFPYHMKNVTHLLRVPQYGGTIRTSLVTQGDEDILNNATLQDTGSEEIVQKLYELYDHATETKRIDTSEIANALEPLFQKCGYREEPAERPLRILLFHDDGVGDFINCSPAIREVRCVYPDAHITLLVYQRSHALALTCPYVDQVLVDARDCDWHDAMQIYHWDIELAQKLLPMHFDICFLFTTWGSSFLLSYLCGATRRVGFDPSGFSCSGPFAYEHVGGFVTDRVPCKLRQSHSLYRYLPMIEYITGKETEDCQPELWVLEMEKKRWQEKLQQEGAGADWLAVVLGGTDARRHWPVDSYAELLKSILAEEDNVRFLILGGPENQEDGDALVRALPEQRAWNVAGTLDYRESSAALSCCKYYIGNDTGLLHAAAALHVPVLTPNCYPMDLPLQGNAVPVVHYPYGVPAVMVRPAHVRAECKDSTSAWGCAQSGQPHCILDISPALMHKGYHLLKDLVQLGKNETYYFYETEDPAHHGKALGMQAFSDLAFQF